VQVGRKKLAGDISKLRLGKSTVDLEEQADGHGQTLSLTVSEIPAEITSNS
jgi:hypothetical protein